MDRYDPLGVISSGRPQCFKSQIRKKQRTARAIAANERNDCLWHVRTTGVLSSPKSHRFQLRKRARRGGWLVGLTRRDCEKMHGNDIQECDEQHERIHWIESMGALANATHITRARILVCGNVPMTYNSRRDDILCRCIRDHVAAHREMHKLPASKYHLFRVFDKFVYQSIIKSSYSLNFLE